MRFLLSLLIAIILHFTILNFKTETRKIKQDYKTAIAFELIEVRQQTPSDNIIEKEEKKLDHSMIKEPEIKKPPAPKTSSKQRPQRQFIDPQTKGFGKDMVPKESGDPIPQVDQGESSGNLPQDHASFSQEIKMAQPKIFHPPRYDHNPVPPYPELAKKRGIQGRVLLEVLVETDGTAKRVSLKESSGSRLLDEAALEAVKRWIFTPATEDGRPVQALVEVPILFRLR